MVKSYLFLFLLAITGYLPVHAQHDSSVKGYSVEQHNGSNLRLSIITCTSGNEPWEAFGHCSIRIIDSTKNGIDRDLVYNYGVLDFFDASFEYKFFNGKMTALLDTFIYDQFVREYAEEKRGMDEYVLLLNNRQKDSIASFIANNMLTENKYYTYVDFFDNCTTRIRDLFIKVFGKSLVWGQAIPKGSRMTFRESFNEYCAYNYWIKLSLNIFFSGRTDKILSNTESMYLPSYLCNGLVTASINGQKICSEKITILEDKLPKPSSINPPFLIFLFIALLTIISLSVERLTILGKGMSILVLFTTGILGCCILYAWFGSGHNFWRNNFNILWALPTNIIIPFLGPKIKAKYALVAMCLLGASLIVHILKVQVMPLFEIGPLLLALLWVYGVMYRKSKV